MQSAATARKGESSRRLLFRGCSVEITSRDTQSLADTATLLAPGTRTSVTALPKEDDQPIMDAVRAARDAGLRAVPHLSARRLTSPTDMHARLEAFAGADAAAELFIIAGDLDQPRGPYPDALSVIRSGILARYGVRHVGIGGYPEGHPKIDDERLWTALLAKASAVAQADMKLSLVTQFGFDPDAALTWVRRVRDAGIDAPIRLGIPGPANAATLLKFAARCGVSASASVLRKYGLSLTRLMQPAGPDAYVERIVHGLSASPCGEVGLHLYPFGGLEKAARWIADQDPSVPEAD